MTINNTNGSGVYSLGNAGLLSAIAGLVTINGTGSDTLNLDDSADAVAQSGQITATAITGMGMGGGGSIAYTGLNLLNLDLGSGSQTLTVAATNAATQTNLTTGDGSNVINVKTNNSALAINAGAGANTINIGNAGVLAGIAAPLTITAGGNSTLNINDQNDTTVNQTGELTATVITGFGMATTGIAYTGMTNVNLSLGSGGTTLTVTSTASAATQINGGNAGDTIQVDSTTGPTTINTGTGDNSITLGDSLSTLAGGLTINGGGTDSLTLDNTTDTTNETGELTASQITGLGMGSPGVIYSGIDDLEIDLGTGNNTFTVNHTSAATTLLAQTGNDTVNVQATDTATVVNIGTGINTVNVGEAQNNGGELLSSIAGALSIVGGGTDTLNLDDTADTTAQTGTVTASAITGLSTAGITYGGDVSLTNLNLSLGNGGNTLSVTSTPTTAITTLNTGDGSDTVTVQSTGGTTNINTQSGNDTIDVQGTNATTTVNTGTGTDTVLVTPLNAIQGLLNVQENAADTLTLNDTGDALARTGTITPTTITGFGMGSNGVNDTGVGTLNLILGAGGTALTVTNTNAQTTTHITGTTGNDTLTVQNDSGITHITAGTGNTNTTLLGTGAATTVTGGDATVGNGSIDAITGPVSIDSTNLTIDDSTSTLAKTSTLDASQLSGLSPAVIGYTGVQNLTIDLGTAANAMNVADTGASTTINGGSGNDVLTLQHDSNATTINTGSATNTVMIQTTGAATTVHSAAGASDTVILGNAGTLAGIASAVTVTNPDVLTLDDSTDSANQTISINTATVTGIAPATVNYTGVSSLNLQLGTGTDSTTVVNTATVTTTNITGGTGTDTFTVQDDSGVTQITGGTIANLVQIDGTDAATSYNTPVGGTAQITVGDAGSTAAINASLTLDGSGNDSLTIDDSADTASLNAILDATTLIGVAPAGITYSGIATLAVDLGNSGNAVTLTNTAPGTSTTLSSGAGDDSISIMGTNGPLVVNTGSGNNITEISGADQTLQTIEGSITLGGNGFDRLSIDDTGDTVAQSETVTASAVQGLGAAPINYGGVAALTVSLGNGGNTLNVTSTHAATTTNISAGDGPDAITVSDAGQLHSIAGPLSIFGTGGTSLTLDDSANTLPTTDTLTDSTFTGANPATIRFNGLQNFNLLLGNGGNTLAVNNTIAGNTRIETGAGNDAVTISATTGSTTIQSGTGATQIHVGSDLNNVAGPLTLAGNGNTQVMLDDSSSNIDQSIVVGSGTITGLNPGSINYTAAANLALQLGSGSDHVVVGSTPAGTNTVVNAGTGLDGFEVLATGDQPASGLIQGPVTINGGSSLQVNDSADSIARNVTVTASTLTGLGANINYTNVNSLMVELGSSNDELTINSINPATPTRIDGGSGSNSATLNFAGDFNGQLTLQNFQGGELTIAGNDNGSISTDGNLNSVSIGGSVASGASLAVAGNMASVQIGGNNSGTITAGSTNAGVITNAVPDANGFVFSVTSGGITRSVQAISASGQPLVGATFDLVYQGTTANPSVSIQVNNASGQVFDLVVQASNGGTLNLSSLTSASGAAGIRNVAINGSLLPGGIVLPSDHLAAVSVTGNLPARSIEAASIQAFGFSSMTGLRGKISRAGLLMDPKGFVYFLTVNPATGKPYAAFAPVSDPLQWIAAAGQTVGLYAVSPNGAGIDKRGILLTAGNQPISITLDFGTDSHHRNFITDLSMTGNGGSISTYLPVQSITSDGSLGNVQLMAGASQQLESLTASNITGNIDLHGGMLVGTLQTTGVQTNPLTGATQIVPANLGSMDGNQVTSVRLNLASGASIVSRGDLLSQVQLTGSLSGTIAAAGNIGLASVNTAGQLNRLGGIQAGKGSSKGQVIALGNILGDVSIAGPLSGQIAAQGTAIDGLSSSRQGILGQLRIGGAITPSGNVVSGGEIGDATDGTQLRAASVKGQILAVGNVSVKIPGQSHSVYGGLGSGAVNSEKKIWTAGNVPITGFDSDTGQSDLALLAQLQGTLKNLNTAG